LEAEPTFDRLRQLVIEAAQELATGLPQDPTADRDLPRTPRLYLSIPGPIVVLSPSSFIRTNLKLTETNANLTPAADKAVRLEVRDPPGLPTEPCPGPKCRVFSGTTDGNGNFTSSFYAGNTDGLYHVNAIFTRANGEKFARESEYEIVTAAHLQLLSPQLDLRAGQFTTVNLLLTTSDGTPARFAHVDFAATLGTIFPTEVTTDEDGSATLTFTAGSSNGTAEIQALYSPPPSTGQQQISSLLKLNVTGAVAMNMNVQHSGVASLAEGEVGEEPPVVLPGGIANLFADLLVGDDRVAALPVGDDLRGPVNRLGHRHGHRHCYGRWSGLHAQRRCPV
jgi:hypothetical protein